jgi:hypothetical protein
VVGDSDGSITSHQVTWRRRAAVILGNKPAPLNGCHVLNENDHATDLESVVETAQRNATMAMMRRNESEAFARRLVGGGLVPG